MDNPHKGALPEKCPVTGWPVDSRPGWVYAENNFTIRYEILDGRFVHAVAEGYLQEDYIDQVYDLRRQVFEEAGLAAGFEGFISNFGAFSGISYRARLKYITLLKQQYEQTPFKSYTIYGASRWLNAAVRLSSVFLPIKTATAADYAGAVTLVAGQDSDPADPPDGRHHQGVEPPNSVANYIEELYAYIGAIDWQKRGFEYPVDISEDNPLRPVFDVIDLVKGEVDELFEEHQLSDYALRHSREQYRALLGAIPDPVVIYDAKGNATYVNKAFEKVYGWKKEALIGRPIDFVPPEEIERTRAVWEDMVNTGQSFFETRRYNRSGRKLDIQTSSAAIRNQAGEHIASIVIHRDVSERRRAEKTMNQQFKYLSALHQTTLGVISRRGLNDLLKTIVTRSAELVGVPHGFIYLYDQEAHTLTLEVGTGQFKDYIGSRIKPGVGLAGKAWEKGEPICVSDYQGWEDRDPDAKWNQVQVAAGIPIKSKSEIIGVIIVADDNTATRITGNEIGVLNRFAQLTAIAIENARLYQQMQLELAQRKRAEEEIRTSHRKLETAKKAAEAATRAKSDFLANMSHEIRTPLNAITGFTRLLLETDIASQQREYLKLISGSSDILLHLINDILDFSKIEAGKLDLENEPFRLQAVVESLRDIYPEKTNEQTIELIVDVHTDVPSILAGDALRLKQVLINLTSNALKFTEKGKVVVQVRVKRVLDQQVELEFSVTDTGIGIHPDQLSRLFDSFAQADASTTRNYGGTGLGLAICKKLVQMMQGDIRVASELGQGSCFSFTALFGLPKNVRQQASDASVDSGPMYTPIAAAFENPADGLRGLRILLAEDNEINRRLATSILSAAGIEVDTATDGRAAVDAVSHSRYDAVLMDIHMPEIDGYAATRMIRKKPEHTDLPIIAMTADAMAGAREKCYAAGMNDYVTKPIDTEQLFKVLSRWAGYGRTEEDAGGKGAAEPGSAAGQTEASLKLPGVDLSEGLQRLGGNRALLMELLHDFCDTYADADEDVVSLLDSDPEAAHRLVHTIKGTAGNLAAVSVKFAAIELEKGLLQSNSGELSELISNFGAALDQLKRSVERLDSLAES